MAMSFLTKMFGSKNERELRKMQPAVDRINALEPAMQAMSDEEMRALTGRFKERVERGEPLDDLLPEAFAAVREASVRTLGHAAFRRPADRRHGPASGQDRRDEDR